MFSRLQVLKRANKRSTGTVKQMIKAENLARKIMKGAKNIKFTCKSTIFIKGNFSLHHSIIIFKTNKYKSVIYTIFPTRIYMSNVEVKNIERKIRKVKLNKKGKQNDIRKFKSGNWRRKF